MPVAGVHDLGLRFGRREGDALDVLDVVDAVVAGDDQAQRAAVGERERRAIHLPGQQRVVHRLQRDRALDHDRERVDVVGKLLAAGAGEVEHAGRDAAERLDDVAHRNAAPDHAAGGADGPRRAARLAREVAAPVARALQHRRDGLDADRLQLGDRQRARIANALDRDLPGVAVGDDRRVGRGQVVADVEMLGRRDAARAERAALGLDRRRAVDDDRVRILPGDVRRQRPRSVPPRSPPVPRLRCGLAGEPDQAGAGQGAGAAGEKLASAKRERRVGHR